MATPAKMAATAGERRMPHNTYVHNDPRGGIEALFRTIVGRP